MIGRVRCGIYTRKSSEEGLEQSFNSLHAQREACEAYVASQRHEGWQALSTAPPPPPPYDDGGFSGGSTDRPGLKRLLADIAAGEIDTVVVYKVDRLTRSLADFAKIVELFDSKQVSFVSVTQQFNTTTSMGRLTLNVLLSFAQFEREVTGERIRDKIAASKAKGMWMGGTVPLGYDLREKKLYINPGEAEQIGEIFREYLRIGSVAGLKEYLDHRASVSKLRVLKGGAVSGGGKFFRGALYRLLNNHLYVGDVAHHGNVYKGEHEAIIDRDQWLKVQNLIAGNRQGPKQMHRASKRSLLVGILFDEEGNRLTPTHANKSGKRYRYYTSQSVIRKAGTLGSITRIAAAELEQAVLGRIEAFLASDQDLLAVAQEFRLLGQSLESLFQVARRLFVSWNTLSFEGKDSLVREALLGVVVHSGEIGVTVDISKLLNWKHETDVRGSAADGDYSCILRCPFTQARRGQELRLIIDGAEPLLATSTTTFLKAIARARLWYEQMVAGEFGSIPELAAANGVTPRYVKKILRCALLCPEGVEAVLAGKCPLNLNMQSLTDDLPSVWCQQANVFYRA